MEESASGELPLWIVVIIPFAFFFVFPLFWCFVIWILSHVGGWNRLAKRYRTDREPKGTTWPAVHGKVGMVSYKGALTCTTNSEGLFLQPLMIFRFAHPRLFIPWSEFHEVSRQRILWFTFVSAKIGDPPAGSLSLDTGIFEGSEGRKLLPKNVAGD